MTTVGAINFESTEVYRLTVQVSDVAGNAADNIITVNVGDLDEEAPTITTFSFTVNEDAPINHPVGTVTATDNVRATGFQIIGGNTGNAFAIANSGVLTTAGVIDLATTPSYSLRIRVSDAAGNSADFIVTVTVVDGQAPTVNSQTFSVREKLPVGTTVGTVAANDIGGMITGYQFPAGGNTEGAFNINNNGVLTTARMLNFTNQSSYSLSVEATDNSGNVGNGTITVNVTDNTRPVINNQNFLVDENVTAGTLVASAVSASDNADTGVTGFQIIAGNIGTAFAINSSGRLTTTGAAIDYETTTRYSLTVSARDAANNSSSATITVNVRNQPDTLAKIYDLHANNTFPTGITYYNSRFYVVDQTTDKVYYYNTSFGSPGSFNIASGIIAQGKRGLFKKTKK